jgi:predicted AlkP superfamily pyrophosphatase or phosphodiesterase
MKFLVSLLVWISISGLSFGQSKSTPYVLLISFDGFRFDYAEKFDAPNFKSLMKSGSYAEGLIPSFPSKTLPNHYSIVTGLYPGKHGLVDNSFFDPDRNEFFEMRNRDRVTDPYYYSGTPLWKLARSQGIKSASMFWVGSELTPQELRPDYYHPYQESVHDSTRIQQVFQWLKLPEKDRPHFITLYFSYPDHEGHQFGPASEETRRAVLKADRTLEIIMKGIHDIDLPINVIVISDHGMEELKTHPDTYIFINEIINRNDTTVRVSNSGTHAHIYLQDVTKVDSIYNVLKRGRKNYSVYRQKDFPHHWHYRTPRAGDLVITANAGRYLVEHERKTFIANVKVGNLFGTHGYDPEEVNNMKGIFYAAGPNIKAGKKIPAFNNVHIYPLIAEILGLKAPATDGDIKILAEILVQP